MHNKKEKKKRRRRKIKAIRLAYDKKKDFKSLIFCYKVTNIKKEHSFVRVCFSE